MTEPSYTSTLPSAMYFSTRTFFRLPMPLTVSRRRRRPACLREHDAPGRQEHTHAVGTLPAVDVLQIVGAGVEGDEGNALRRGAPAQVRVEGLLPGRVVNERGLGEDTVQIEQAGRHVRWKPKHPLNLTVKRKVNRISAVSNPGRGASYGAPILRLSPVSTLAWEKNVEPLVSPGRHKRSHKGSVAPRPFDPVC